MLSLLFLLLLLLIIINVLYSKIKLWWMKIITIIKWLQQWMSFHSIKMFFGFQFCLFWMLNVLIFVNIEIQMVTRGWNRIESFCFGITKLSSFFILVFNHVVVWLSIQFMAIYFYFFLGLFWSMLVFIYYNNLVIYIVNWLLFSSSSSSSSSPSPTSGK